MLGPSLIGRKIGEVDLSLLGGGKLNLCLLSSFLHSLNGKIVLLDVDSTLLLEFSNEILLEDKIEIFSSKRRISIGSLNLEDSS